MLLSIRMTYKDINNISLYYTLSPVNKLLTNLISFNIIISKMKINKDCIVIKN